MTTNESRAVSLRQISQELESVQRWIGRVDEEGGLAVIELLRRHRSMLQHMAHELMHGVPAEAVAPGSEADCADEHSYPSAETVADP